MEDRSIIIELEKPQLINLINQIDKDGDKTLLLKFSADWCKPCKSVSQLCRDAFGKMPYNVIIANIDIDKSLDLYMMFKKKRMLTGIPCILSWYPVQDRDTERWYIPDDSVLTSSKPDHISFFQRALTKAQEIKYT